MKLSIPPENRKFLLIGHHLEINTTSLCPFRAHNKDNVFTSQIYLYIIVYENKNNAFTSESDPDVEILLPL